MRRFKVKSMVLPAVLTGALGFCGAMIFKKLVAFFHNAFLLGKFSFTYNEFLHTAMSPWGMGIILVPVIGGLIVIWLIEHYAHDQRGLSVPEIIYQVQLGNAEIQASKGFAKILATIISVGSGASVGREGPIVQMGAIISSLLSDFFDMSVEQRKVLIAAGAATGTAVIFNAPIAGIFFAIELLLISKNLSSISMVLIATLTATLLNILLTGNDMPLQVNISYQFVDCLSFVLHSLLFLTLGLIIGLISILYIRSIYWMEDVFTFLFKNPYIRHMIGTLIIGIMMYLMMRMASNYYIQGIGLATIMDCVKGVLLDPQFLLLLFLAKLMATSLSLGSGASGGIFSPILFMGATLGSAIGIMMNALIPDLGIHPLFFTMVGMASSVGAATGAVLTAIALTFEITRSVSSIIPMFITSYTAYYVRKQLCIHSIYTLKLFRRGIII